MAQFDDHEFGTVTVRKSGLSKKIRISIAPSGQVRISTPTYTPLFVAKRVLASSRASVRSLLKDQKLQEYTDSMQIGKSHHLTVERGGKLKANRKKQRVIVTLPDDMALNHPEVQRVIRTAVITALRIEAKSYLSKRLEYLAKQHGFFYQSVRFSHASSRWGSCSSSGVISLNIALMNLDFELIDYVLLHELAHTKEMNHSPRFWELLEGLDPEAKEHRARLRTHSPHI